MDWGGFVATHAVPAGGTAFWHHPDGARPADGRLDAHLPVQVVDQALGWAHVRCSNGWETWVDGRVLVAPGAPVAAGPPSRAQSPGSAASTRGDPVSLGLPAAGAVLAILGGFLPWYRGFGVSISAWDLPVKSLVDTQNASQGLDTGPVLLVLAIALVPLLTRRPLPRALTGVLGGVALVIGLLGLRLYADTPEPRPSLGVGLLLTVLGGVLLVVAALRPTSPIQP